MNRLLMLSVLAVVPVGLHADFVSYTATLSSSTDVVEQTFILSSPATIGLQTFGFGGGTNAGGTLISPGGTDPFLAIFSGTGAAATILTDGSSNPFGTSLDLFNYGNPNFVGCPPAGAPVIGGTAQCGDISMTLPSLAAGTYTVVLSDGQYVANAVFDNGTLGEGFTDFTGGAFCNVVINGAACPDPLGGAYAFDITGLPGAGPPPPPVPEPAFGAMLLGTVLLGPVFITNSRRKKETLQSSGVEPVENKV
ncbi:MAG TPA: DVUA0089 family protein [Bryobacteraceae bacterium]|jgi:hypothetical protein|nr:DVUA0089 family protein [Bryobacteraceae bacterium]